MERSYNDFFKELKSHGMFPSISEERYVDSVSNDVLNILSVGVSAGGFGEAILAKIQEKRSIVATTIDQKGVLFSRELFKKLEVDNQIDIKFEDVSKPNTYQDNTFDEIYARLVLHYLSNANLDLALQELNRVLKPGGRMFIVVRSVKNIDYEDMSTKVGPYDEETGFTKISFLDENGNVIGNGDRRFHTPDTLKGFIIKHGFDLVSSSEYEELLCKDYQRKIPSDQKDHLIEMIVKKI